MTREQSKEDLSIGYISTVCAQAGIDYEIYRHDADSSDGSFKKCIDLPDGPYLAECRVQLKCTSSKNLCRDTGDTFVYRLKKKNYDDLRMPASDPIILCLLVLPETEKNWVEWSVDRLVLNGCMYWCSLLGLPDSDNQETVSVAFEKSHTVNMDNLVHLLTTIANGEDLK